MSHPYSGEYHEDKQLDNMEGLKTEKRYKVTANYRVYLEGFVIAKNEEEAREKADELALNNGLTQVEPFDADLTVDVEEIEGRAS